MSVCRNEKDHCETAKDNLTQLAAMQLGLASPYNFHNFDGIKNDGGA